MLGLVRGNFLFTRKLGDQGSIPAILYVHVYGKIRLNDANFIICLFHPKAHRWNPTKYNQHGMQPNVPNT